MVPTLIIIAVVAVASWYAVRTVRRELKGGCSCDHCPTKQHPVKPR